VPSHSGACEIDLWVGGTHRELGEERLVHTQHFDEFPRGDSVVTTTLVKNAGTTTLNSLAVFNSKQVLDGVIASKGSQHALHSLPSFPPEGTGRPTPGEKTLAG
jgi:hypothetical protein